MAQTAALATAFVLLLAGGAKAIVCNDGDGEGDQCTTVSASGYPHSNFYNGIVRICEGTFSETTGSSVCTQIGTGAIRGNNNHKIFTSKDVYNERIKFHLDEGRDVFALTTDGYAAKLKKASVSIVCETAAVAVQQRSDGQYMPADSAFYPPGVGADKWGNMRSFTDGDECKVFGWVDGQLKSRSDINMIIIRENKYIVARSTYASGVLQEQDAGAPVICRNAVRQDWHIEGASIGNVVWSTKQC